MRVPEMQDGAKVILYTENRATNISDTFNIRIIMKLLREWLLRGMKTAASIVCLIVICSGMSLVTPYMTQLMKPYKQLLIQIK